MSAAPPSALALAAPKLRAVARGMLPPPPDRDACGWADANRKLGAGSLIPGRWRSELSPYWLEPARMLALPHVTRQSIVTPNQVGKSEYTLNAIGWTVDDRPAPGQYVLPTEALARDMSKDRLRQMLEETDSLSIKCDRRREYWGIAARWVSGQRVGVSWAGSQSALAMRPCGWVIVDELDAMQESIGTAGDPLLQARARVKNAPNPWVLVVSTPTIDGASPIMDEWLAGSRRAWELACRHCNAWFRPLMSEHLVYEGDDELVVADSARMACPECGALHDDAQRRQAIPDGRYRCFDVAENGALQPSEALREEYTHQSYWITGLASPWTTLAEYAVELWGALKTGNPAKIQVVMNGWSGEPYALEGESPGYERALARRLDYVGVHPDAQLLTVGIDVQQHDLRIAARGWGAPNAESWGAGYFKLPGSTQFDDVYVAAMQFCNTHWGRPPDIVIIDAGYRPGDRFVTPTHQVFSWCRRAGWVAAMGREHLSRPFQLAKPDLTPTGKADRSGVRLYLHDASYWKRWLYGRIDWPADTPGGWWLPRDASEEYAKELTNEQEIIDPNTQRVRWVRTGNRQNHAMDCEILATIGAYVLNVEALAPLAPVTTPSVSRETEPSSADEPGFETF